MLRAWRENWVLKIVSLLASISLWLYVSAERFPNTAYQKSVNAEVVKQGSPPPDVIVRIRPDSFPIEVSGPKNEVDSIDENEIKAVVDVRGARLGTTQLRIIHYQKPGDTPNVEVKVVRQNVTVEVLPKARRQMQIIPVFNTNTTSVPNPRYQTPNVKPEWAYISGPPDDVKRVQRLLVPIDTSGGPVSADLAIRAEDRDGVEVTGLEITPAAAHVEVALEQPPATRQLVVNAEYMGKPAAGYTLTEVIVEPSTVMVAGKPDQIQALSNIPTQELNIEGISGEVTKVAALRPPDGVSVVGGKPTVKVIFRAQEVAKAAAGGAP